MTAYAEKNAAILGVSFDNPEKNAAFAEKFGFQYPLLSDVDRQIGLAYGAATSPDQLWAVRTGVIIGPDGRITHYFPKVAARAFPQEALLLV
jgi:peroxiredoxin Q/BCP